MTRWNLTSKAIAKRFTSLSISISEILGVIFIVGILCILLLLWGFKSLIHSKNEQTVPDLHNKSVMAALDELSPKKLAIRKMGVEFDSSIPAGAVIRQSPSPNTAVREGKVIRVWLSQGGEAVFAPNLIGLPLRNAELLLRQKQLAMGEVTESYSLAVEKGFIITQKPKPDASLSKNTIVSVVVSAGIPPENIILMPYFRQKRIEDAEFWAAENEIKLNITEDKQSVFPRGTILAQSPSPDTVVTTGLNASVTISGRKSDSADGKKVHEIKYKMVKRGNPARVRIVLTDKSGEREIFNGVRDAGSDIDLTVPYGGPAKVRIFVNGVLVEEKVEN